MPKAPCFLGQRLQAFAKYLRYKTTLQSPSFVRILVSSYLLSSPVTTVTNACTDELRYSNNFSRVCLYSTRIPSLLGSLLGQRAVLRKPRHSRGWRAGQSLRKTHRGAKGMRLLFTENMLKELRVLVSCSALFLGQRPLSDQYLKGLNGKKLVEQAHVRIRLVRYEHYRYISNFLVLGGKKAPSAGV